jgi:hypothetical protein
MPPAVRADELVHTWLMATHRASWVLMIVSCALPLAGSGCDGKASSSDAASVGPTSTGGAASGGTLGAGGGSGGRDGGATVNGGAGGSGGTTMAGGTTGSGGTTNSSGSGGTASSGGTTGLGGSRDGGNVDSPTGLGGKQDGGDVDAPGTLSTGGASGLDAAADGGTEPRCVGTPSNSYCPASDSSCYQVKGCHMQVPTTGHCLFQAARACSYNTTPTSCAAESGCVWSVDGGSSAGCGGTARDCTDGMSSAECAAAGCPYFTNAQYCTGTPTPCTQLSAADCASQPGCALSTAGG